MASQAHIGWSEHQLSDAVVERCGQARTEMFSREVRELASLLKRLGHPKSRALHRCLGNRAWSESFGCTPALSKENVRAIVAEVYER